MTTRIIFSLFFVIAFLRPQAASAQLPHWAVRPLYQSVEKPVGIDLLVAQRGDSTSVFTFDGRLLTATTDRIEDFQNGCGLTLLPGTQTVTGFFTADRYVPLPQGCTVPHDYPFFSDGFLLVKLKGGYRFVDATGRMVFDEYAQAYPFQNGYAFCTEVRDNKRKSFYIDTQGVRHASEPQRGPDGDGGVIETTTLVVPVHAPNGRVGIRFKGGDVLPPQFDEVEPVGLLTAKVRTGGVWGVITIDSLATLQPLLNSGHPVEFRQQEATATLSLLTPEGFSPSSFKVTTDGTSSLRIRNASRSEYAVLGHPAVNYDCDITLPPTMLVDTTVVDYQLNVSYDGMKLNPMNLSAGLQYIQLLSLADIEPGTFAGDVYTFDIHVIDRRDVDPATAPYTVEVYTNRELVELNRLTMSHYKCRMRGIDKEDNNVYICIQETGCPKVVVTYEVVYQPASAQTGGKKKTYIRKKQQQSGRIQQGGGQQQGTRTVNPVIIPL